jgi:Ca-activated chloride channel family protein
VVRAIPRRDGFDVALLADRPSDAADGWFIARIVPKLAAPPAIPRDVAFVIDRSGSMQGRKIEQARAALLAGLDTLKPGDRFDVISFSSDVTSLGEGRWLDATAENLKRARRAADDIAATGGTNIADALKAATRPRGGDGAGRLAAVVFLTDGDPTVGETAPERILAAWRQQSAGTRLFAFGVGNDVKDFLLTKLAVEGRGDARYVREDENLEVALGALFERLRTPLLIDPWSTSKRRRRGRALDREPRRLPDLFQGRALLVCGRFRGAGKAVLHLSGNSGGESISVDVPVEFPKSTPRRDFVAQIWAKTRVERLLDDLRVSGGNAEIKNEVLSLGLAHQLVTPYTSFLVVEDNVKLADGGAVPHDGRVADEGTDPGRMPGVPGIGGGGDTTPPGNLAARARRLSAPRPGTSGPATGGPGAPATGGWRRRSRRRRRFTGATAAKARALEFWWEHNKDPFLAEDAARGASVRGRGGRGDAARGARRPECRRRRLGARARPRRAAPCDGSVRAATTTLHHPGRPRASRRRRARRPRPAGIDPAPARAARRHGRRPRADESLRRGREHGARIRCGIARNVARRGGGARPEGGRAEPGFARRRPEADGAARARDGAGGRGRERRGARRLPARSHGRSIPDLPRLRAGADRPLPARESSTARTRPPSTPFSRRGSCRRCATSPRRTTCVALSPSRWAGSRRSRTTTRSGSWSRRSSARRTTRRATSRSRRSRRSAPATANPSGTRRRTRC